MTWAKLDDGFTFHPKVILAGNEGAGIFARCLAYCGRYETDGKVPGEVALGIAGSKKALERVVSIGLVERLDGGVIYIRDYLHYNPPADEIDAKREERKARAKKAADARWRDA